MPIYIGKVKLNGHEAVRLIDAPNEARALKHLACQHLSVESVRTAEQIKQTAELAATGVKVEVAAE